MKRFTVPIYGTRIHYTPCPDEMVDWINRKGVQPYQGAISGLTVGVGNDVLIFAPELPILAHEAFHAANMVLDHIGDEKRDEEVVAYLIQFIFEKCAA